MNLDGLFKNSLYTFYYARQPLEPLGAHTAFADGVISHTPKTFCKGAGAGESSAAVVGFCADSHGEISREDIPLYIARHTKNARELAALSDRLAGKYVIMARYGAGDFALLTDAAASLPVFYHTGGAVCVSSLEYLAARELSLPLSEKSAAIERRSQPHMPLPGDITAYDGLLCLLPNHWLDMKAHRAVRFYPESGGKKNSLSAGEAVKLSEPLIRNTVAAYAGEHRLLCPVTGGYDSRLALAFLLACGLKDDLLCYTSNHSGFTAESADIAMPARLTEMFGLNYRLIEDLKAPEEMREAVCEIFRKSEGVEDAAFTQISLFGDRLTICGDIIDQVGKSAIGADIPAALATASYFQCKSHVFSPYAKAEIKKWLKGARVKGAYATPYDLFAVESRCGRWAAGSQNIYSVLGNNALNIFNCREVIDTWVRVPRGQRIRRELHREFFKSLCPEMLDVPFNPGAKYSYAKNHAFTLWLATYLRYFMDKRRM